MAPGALLKCFFKTATLEAANMSITEGSQAHGQICYTAVCKAVFVPHLTILSLTAASDPDIGIVDQQAASGLHSCVFRTSAKHMHRALGRNQATVNGSTTPVAGLFELS